MQCSFFTLAVYLSFGEIVILVESKDFFLQLNNFNQAVHCCGLLKIKIVLFSLFFVVFILLRWWILVLNKANFSDINASICILAMSSNTAKRVV